MTQFWLIFAIAIVFVAIAFVGLAFKILFEKKGQFPNMHIGSNEYLKSQGVTCAQTYDKIEQAKVRRTIDIKKIKLLEDQPGSC